MIGSLFVLYMKKLPWLSMVDHKFNFKIFKNFKIFNFSSNSCQLGFLAKKVFRKSLLRVNSRSKFCCNDRIWFFRSSKERSNLISKIVLYFKIVFEFLDQMSFSRSLSMIAFTSRSFMNFKIVFDFSDLQNLISRSSSSRIVCWTFLDLSWSLISRSYLIFMIAIYFRSFSRSY